MTSPRAVVVPPERLQRWCDNFTTRHGATAYSLRDGHLELLGEDGAAASVALPFGRRYDGPAEPAGVIAAATDPLVWGVLLVRKGGFAVALLDGSVAPGQQRQDHRGVVASKVGQRHVQGRTKAGGQSQQRFARRRDNQARQAYEAAADHAARVLLGADPRSEPDPTSRATRRRLAALVCGGDRAAVDEVLDDRRLAALRSCVVDPWLPVPDPRRAVLDEAIATARSLHITLQ